MNTRKSRANCQFKDISGTVWDKFRIKVPESLSKKYITATDMPAKPDTISFVAAIDKKMEFLPFGTTMHRLQFRLNIPVDSTISNCQLQIMLSNENRSLNVPKIDVEIKGGLASNQNSKSQQLPLLTFGQSHTIKVDLNEIEHGEVWVSPDLDNLVLPQIQANNVDITLEISGSYAQDYHAFKVGFFGYHSFLKSCVSPTLFCKLNNSQ